MRYDKPNDIRDERLREVAYVVGLALRDRMTRHAAQLVEGAIVGLYDHKGDLDVVVRGELSEGVQAVFRAAWAEVGRELPENVYFPDVYATPRVPKPSLWRDSREDAERPGWSYFRDRA